jgi:hypothetical protein
MGEYERKNKEQIHKELQDLDPMGSPHKEDKVIGGNIDLIRLKRIYNFLCSMLGYAPFALCFVTLHGVFMHFPELTINEMPHCQFPIFCVFCVSKKLH